VSRISRTWRLRPRPMVLIITPSFPASTPRELIDYLKVNPGKVNWASAGVNSTPHVSMAIFIHATGVKLTHVPYKGAPLALIDIVGGQVAGMHTSVASAESQIQSGRVRVIAVAGPKRLSSIPDVPTLAEAGIENAEAPNFYGMAAPAHTPPAIVRKLNAGVKRRARTAGSAPPPRRSRHGYRRRLAGGDDEVRDGTGRAGPGIDQSRSIGAGVVISATEPHGATLNTSKRASPPCAARRTATSSSPHLPEFDRIRKHTDYRNRTSCPTSAGTTSTSPSRCSRHV